MEDYQPGIAALAAALLQPELPHHWETGLAVSTAKAAGHLVKLCIAPIHHRKPWQTFRRLVEPTSLSLRQRVFYLFSASWMWRLGLWQPICWTMRLPIPTSWR